MPISPIPAANVAAVPQRSPLCYPGGKTWLIPHVRSWLRQCGPNVPLIIEPFAGGGIVSITAVMEYLARSCLMAELDRDVAVFWHASLSAGRALARRIREFEPSREAVDALSEGPVSDVLDHGFRTLVIKQDAPQQHPRAGRLVPARRRERQGHRIALVRRNARAQDRRDSVGTPTAYGSPRPTDWHCSRRSPRASERATP